MQINDVDFNQAKVDMDRLRLLRFQYELIEDDESKCEFLMSIELKMKIYLSNWEYLDYSEDQNQLEKLNITGTFICIQLLMLGVNIDKPFNNFKLSMFLMDGIHEMLNIYIEMVQTLVR